jgi:acyl-CoA hydrolase
MPGQQRELVLRFLAEPSDVNFGGKVHGGAVMKWIDQAGYAAAVGWSGHYCVTVAVGGIRFAEPILIGDLVAVRAKLVRTGTTSMQFAVDVQARDLASGIERRATGCVITFVALDGPAGRPVPVPAWHPVVEEDLRLAAFASRIGELSRAMGSEGSSEAPASDR